VRNQNQPVASEGYPFIAVFAFVTLVFAMLGWGSVTILCLGLTLFTAYFFRNPERTIPEEEDAVVAPADGTVIYVGEVTEERCLQGPAVKVSIFMSVFNVHVNRVPVSGKVVEMFYNKGSFLNASLDKASLQNEQAGMLIETASGARLLVVQIAGLIARRIVTYPKVGSVLAKGQRYGLIRFGSRVDVYFPRDADVLACVGDRTVAGETILGYLR